MVNSILIGKLLYNLLSDDEALNKMVKNRIYPLIAEQETKLPFVIYYRTNIISNGSKDGYIEDSVTFTVTAVSADYRGSLDIANRLRQIIEKRKIESTDLTLYNIKLTSIDESFEDNAYIQKLDFECKAN